MRSTAPLVEDIGKKFWHPKPLLPEGVDKLPLSTRGLRPANELPRNNLRVEPKTMGRVIKANTKVDVAKDAEDRGGKRL